MSCSPNISEKDDNNMKLKENNDRNEEDEEEDTDVVVSEDETNRLLKEPFQRMSWLVLHFISMFPFYNIVIGIDFLYSQYYYY